VSASPSFIQGERVTVSFFYKKGGRRKKALSSDAFAVSKFGKGVLAFGIVVGRKSPHMRSRRQVGGKRKKIHGRIRLSDLGVKGEKISGISGLFFRQGGGKKKAVAYDDPFPSWRAGPSRKKEWPVGSFSQGRGLEGFERI